MRALAIWISVFAVATASGEDVFYIYYGPKDGERKIAIKAEEMKGVLEKLTPQSALAFLSAKTGSTHRKPFRFVEEPDIYECSDNPAHRFRVPAGQSNLTKIVKVAAGQKVDLDRESPKEEPKGKPKDDLAIDMKKAGADSKANKK